MSLVQAELRKDSIDKYEKNPKTEETLLHLATKSGDVEIVRLLLENQFSVYSRDKDGNTPLHLFCRFANSPSDNLLKLFQQQNSREDIFNIKNNFGETPLHYVVFNPYLRVVLAETLLAAGANPNIQAENHDTPLHYAVQLGREDLVKVMICFGADETIVGARDCTASVLAKQLGFENVASSIKDTIELKSYLKRINMEKYLSTFVMEDLYLCHFPDLSESILSKLIKDESDRQVLLDAAKDVKAVCSTESVARKKEYVKKKENQKLKESQVRQVLESKLKTDFQWEIEIEDLEFIQLLGNGASGEVYKGLNGKTVCAIKVLKTLNENWTKEVQDFTAEFNIAYKIKSPHIVTFFGATLKQKLCMVMEYCGKGSLFHLLKDEYQIFDWTTSLRMLEEIVLGVLALHRHKPIILHRDLKTLNVLVTEDLSCKLCDFGLSRFDTTTSLDTLQKCRGTFAYIAPEVFRREGYDIKSDVYSISIIMWEVLNRLLTGRYSRPFAYLASEFAILIEACEKGERPEFPDKTPTLFSSLVERCWEPVKDKRLDSEQLLIEIDNIQEEYKTNQSKWDILIKNPDKCRSSKKSKHQSQKRH
uniref:Protein kinase domain-containing protein n=1 Tax=Arcella intermedia TaxID=1963864 RepID=A0A6B2KZW2_9EUKA